MQKRFIPLIIPLILAELLLTSVESIRARPCFGIDLSNVDRCRQADVFDPYWNMGVDRRVMMQAQLGAALNLMSQNRLEEALVEYNAIIEAFPDLDTREASYGAGVSEFGLGRYVQAGRDFELALGSDYNVDAWLCVTNAIVDRYEAALDHCAQGIELDPNYESSALFWRGYIEVMQGDYQLAIADLEQATAHQPDSPGHFYHLGIAYLLDNQDVLATRLFSDLAVRDSGLYTPHFWLAVIAMKQADAARAKQELQIAINFLRVSDDDTQKRGTALISALLGNPEGAITRYLNAYAAGDTDRQNWSNHRLYLLALRRLFPGNLSVRSVNSWFTNGMF